MTPEVYLFERRPRRWWLFDDKRDQVDWCRAHMRCGWQITEKRFEAMPEFPSGQVSEQRSTRCRSKADDYAIGMLAADLMVFSPRKLQGQQKDSDFQKPHAHFERISTRSQSNQ